MNNLKIEVNKDQQLDEIVMELERLGYIAWCIDPIKSGFVVTSKIGSFTNVYNDPGSHMKLTTLAELKEMK